jgi:hypothetical protein
LEIIFKLFGRTSYLLARLQTGFSIFKNVFEAFGAMMEL